MPTLQERIESFLRKNSPPDAWKEGLKTLLPATGAVEHIPLVIVVECLKDKKTLVFILAADEVCTVGQCEKLNVTPPDGKSLTWGDLVPNLVELLLPEHLEKRMSQKGKNPLLNVPETWDMIFPVFAKGEIPIGASS